MAQKILVIMSGISGSGKSFLADALKDHYEHNGKNVVICSTDYYWYSMVGDDPDKYDFVPELVRNAHIWNIERVTMFLHPDITDYDVVIVDDTNVREKEVKVYVEIAKNFDAELRIISLNVPIDIAKKYNNTRPDERKVPEKTIDRQQRRKDNLDRKLQSNDIFLTKEGQD